MDNDSFEISSIIPLTGISSMARFGVQANSRLLTGQMSAPFNIPSVGNRLPSVLKVADASTVEINSSGQAASNQSAIDPYKDTEDLYRRMSDYTKQTSSYQRSISNIEHTAKILDVEMPETMFSMRNSKHLPNPIALIHEASKLHTQFSLFNTFVGGLTKGVNKLLSATS